MADVEMVERVKAALIAEDESVGGTRHAAYWGDMARAAIEALREPTEAVCEAREMLYEEKAARRDPFREDIANAYDLDKHAAEAMRWLGSEVASLLGDATLKEE